MKEIQIPRKNFPRSSDPGTKRINDSELKNRKVKEKRQSDLSVESATDSMDFTPNSQFSFAISDSEAESIIMQGSSPDSLSTPEICLLTDDSMEAQIDASSTDQIQSIAELQSLRAEINELKILISSVDTCEESNWIDGVFTMNFRIVVMSFILWAILTVIVVFFSSGDEAAYHGPLPT